MITGNQAEFHDFDYDDLHFLIDSDDESDEGNDIITGVSNSVEEDNNTSSVESESLSDGTDTDIKLVNDP